MTDKEKLQQEIKQKEAELAALELKESTSKRDLTVRKLSAYTVEEKCAAFDKLYKAAEAELRIKEDGEYTDDDDSDSAHYMWESVMELLASKHGGFWKYYNSFD